MSKQRRQARRQDRRLMGLVEMGDYRHVQRPRPRFQPWRGPRDAFTGAPLDPAHAVIIRVASDDRVDNRPRPADARAGMRVGPEDVTARPLRLHTTQVESAPDAGDTTRGALGGHAYSRDMARYLQSGLDHDRATARADLWIWYRSAYGRGRARAALIARLGARNGHVAYLAALNYASGAYDAEEIARACGHSSDWVGRMALLAECAAGSVHSTTMSVPRTLRSAETTASIAN